MFFLDGLHEELHDVNRSRGASSDGSSKASGRYSFGSADAEEELGWGGGGGGGFEGWTF